jgi:ketosteroid isomerase-like protein
MPDYRPDFYEVLDALVDPVADSENLKRSRQALRSWITLTHDKDLAGIRALMADDIVIEIPFSESGITEPGHYRVYTGIEECIGFWEVAFQAEGGMYGPLNCEINFTADGGVAFLECRNHLTMTNGRVYRNRYVMRTDFVNGKIAAVREYYNPIQSAYGFRRPIAGQFYLDTLEPSS